MEGGLHSDSERSYPLSIFLPLFLLHGNRLLLGLTVTTATEYCLLTAVRTSTVSRDKDVLGHDSRTLISHRNILQDSGPARDNRQVRHVIATLAYSQLVE